MNEDEYIEHKHDVLYGYEPIPITTKADMMRQLDDEQLEELLIVQPWLDDDQGLRHWLRTGVDE